MGTLSGPSASPGPRWGEEGPPQQRPCNLGAVPPGPWEPSLCELRRPGLGAVRAPAPAGAPGGLTWGLTRRREMRPGAQMLVPGPTQKQVPGSPGHRGLQWQLGGRDPAAHFLRGHHLCRACWAGVRAASSPGCRPEAPGARPPQPPGKLCPGAPRPSPSPGPLDAGR